MEEVLQQIQDFLNFDYTDIILLSLLTLCFIVQIYFYRVYYRKPLSVARQRENNERPDNREAWPKVSVIIVSVNESENLALNLPSILDQDYPDFEVIVVNDGSTDESDMILESLKLKYPNLYSTYLPLSNDRLLSRRKLSLTIGIKAATGDILLFTEPYSRPASDKWITSMIKEFDNDKEVVLGYSYYEKNNKLYNRIARFDNLYFSLRFMSMALKNMPYGGTYSNLAFKRQLFFDNKGFSSLLNMENGEKVFINRIANSSNTAIALSHDSFVETSLYSYSLWRQICNSYINAKKYFKGFSPKRFSYEYYSRFLFYFLFVSLIIKALMPFNPGLLGLAFLLFIIKLVIQMVMINKSARYFKSGKFYFSFPLLEILTPISKLGFK